MSITVADRMERARRAELSLVAVRAFGAVLGLYLVSQTNAGDPTYIPPAPALRLQLAYGVMIGLALVDVVVYLTATRATSLRELAWIGKLAFGADIAALLGLAWIFSFDPRDTTWVVVYVLPLEGAIRYRLAGAFSSVAVTLVSEIGRQAYLAATFPRYDFLLSNVLFVVGIQAIIAAVAGLITRSLAREADHAAEQAARSEEAARRESEARRELAAFNTAILTGVAAEDLDASIRLMAGAIGRDLGWEGFSILILDGPALTVRGMYGLPKYGEPIPLGRGVVGTVARTARPIIVSDVHDFPDYVEGDPEVRSEMAAPMQIGQELIGVLDVQSRVPDAFDVSHLDVLVRLADQIALVVHSNRLLSQQVETVRRLQELDQMKSDFVAVASHELRTPITAIRGFVKTLMRTKDRLTSDQVESFVAIIDRQSARLARLVEDLLFVSRIEAGTIRLQVEDVSLGEFVREAVESLGLEARTRIEASVPHPDVLVRFDPQRVDQILRNLLGNALKFSPAEAPVRLGARVSGGRVEFSVQDLGPGIPPEEVPRIFDRFHQAGEVLSRETEGAGLGLYITKRLTDVMGGTIELTSTPGVGSTFTVTLPVAPAPESEPPEAHPRAGDLSPATPAAP